MENLFSYNLAMSGLFAVVSSLLTSLRLATTVMPSSGHAHGHVTHSEKMQRLPSILSYQYFSLDLIF